jgi:hypothetical protein
MQDIYDLVKNVERVYDSNTAFQVLKDFERVIDELDIYVYKNWEDGELLEGPNIERHWITCKFMWDRNKMPDPMGGKRLLDYDCKVKYSKDYIIKPRKIRNPDDVRPSTKKGKLDKHPVWIVEIQMPKKLVADIYSGYNELEQLEADATAQPQDQAQAADTAAAAPEAAPEAAGGEEAVI